MGEWISELHGIDITIVAIVLVCCILGLVNGLVTQLAGIFSVIAGIFCAWIFSPVLSQFFVNWFEKGALASAAGSFAAFLIGAIAVRLLAALMIFLLRKNDMATANRLAGGAFGIIKGVAIAAVLAFIIGRYGKASLIQDAKLAPPLYEASEWMVKNASESSIGETIKGWGQDIKDGLAQEQPLHEKISESFKDAVNDVADKFDKKEDQNVPDVPEGTEE